MVEENEAFIADPTDHLIGVIDARGEADAAVQQLAEAGFADVKVYHDRAGAEAIDSSGTEHGVVAEVIRSLQQVFSDKDNLAEYEQAIREGSTVVAIQTDDDDQRDRATDILERHAAHDINHFGKAVVRTLKA